MAARLFPEVIDLLDSSSDEDDDIPLPILRPQPIQVDSDDEDVESGAALPGAFSSEPPSPNETATAQPVQGRRVEGGMIVILDGDEIFIPDEEPQPTHTAPTTANDATSTNLHADREFTAEDCLRHVLEIFPDICHDHVHSLWVSFDHENDYKILTGRARLDNIVEQLISSTTYPRHEKAKLKRKRDDSVDGPVDLKKWQQADRAAVPNWAKGSIVAICKADYPAVPRNHINDRLAANQYLFQTYVALAKDEDDSEDGTRIFGRGRVGKAATADADTIAINCGHAELVEELAAARLQVIAARSQREAAKVKKRAEDENLQKAIAAGETAECSACFDDLPMNRQLHCDGGSPHFTCFDCVETYIKSEVGDSRCKVVCPSGCGARFAHNQLHLLENKQLLQKLAQIQQEQDIRDAGLEDLEECPFCDFKAIMPPIEEDFEFRCANPECEKVSCRRCKAISHVPVSCEQHAKDNKLSSRHQIEEAMTAALVRACQKCKKQFIKESGCNKMHCMSCNTLQCYVCSAIVKDYNHFDQGPNRGRTASGAQSSKCPLYDNVEERHEREVKEAEAKARAEVVEKNPDVSAEDLEIKVSDVVKKAETDRLRRAGVGVPGRDPLQAGANFEGNFARAQRLMQLNFGNANEARVGHAGGFGLDLGDDFDEDDIGGMFRPFVGRRAPARPGAGAGRLEDLHRQQRELEQQLEMMRAQYPRDQPAIPDAGLDPEDAVAAYDRIHGNRPDAARPLQGYIPVFFGEGPAVHHAQQAQPPPQPPQQQPAQQPALGPFGGTDLFSNWANPFNGLYGGDPPQQPANAAAAAARYHAPAANAQRPTHNIVPDRPRAARNPFERAQALPYGAVAHGIRPDSPHVPCAFPRPATAAPRAAEPAAQDNQRNRDFEVLRMQHEEIERMRDRRREMAQARQRQQMQEIRLRMPAGRQAGAGAERDRQPY